MTDGGQSLPEDVQLRLERQAARERQRPFLVAMLSLAVVAFATLMSLGVTLSNPKIEPPSSPPTGTDIALVREFYGAINAAIRTGDSFSLNTIVAPDIAWCERCPGQSQTREGLRRYTEGLYRANPDLRLEVESVVSESQGVVTAHVHVSGQPLVSESIVWGPVDTLRIDGGLISELHTRLNIKAEVDPLVKTRFDSLSPAATSVVMARMAFPPNSASEGLLSTGPTILVIESGAIKVRIAIGGRIVRAGKVETLTWNNATILHQGDAAIVPPSVQYGLQQVGTEPAVVVGATTYFADNEIDRSTDQLGLTPFIISNGDKTVLGKPIAINYLAKGDLKGWPAGPVSVALGRVILGADARIDVSANESIVLAVEVGTLVVMGDVDRTIPAGTGLVQPGGVVREIRNAGADPVIFLVMTVAAAADQE